MPACSRLYSPDLPCSCVEPACGSIEPACTHLCSPVVRYLYHDHFACGISIFMAPLLLFVTSVISVLVVYPSPSSDPHSFLFGSLLGMYYVAFWYSLRILARLVCSCPDSTYKQRRDVENDKSCEVLVKGSVHWINIYHIMGMEWSAGRLPCKGTGDQKQGRMATNVLREIGHLLSVT
jgi:hypothetical protein